MSGHRPAGQRFAATLLAYLATLIATAAAMALVVLVLAGPHSDVLPEALAPAVVILAGLAILLLPAWIARRLWRRMA